jgi:hypothetical protein
MQHSEQFEQSLKLLIVTSCWQTVVNSASMAYEHNVAKTTTRMLSAKTLPAIASQKKTNLHKTSVNPQSNKKCHAEDGYIHTFRTAVFPATFVRKFDTFGQNDATRLHPQVK